MLFGLTDTSKRFPLNVALPMVFSVPSASTAATRLSAKTIEAFLDALVQQLSILAGLNYVQSAHMTYQAVSKGMVTEVLTILISIVLFCLRSVQQSETQGVVIRLVPAIFAVVHDGNAIRTVSVR